MPEHQNEEWKESWRDEYLKWICGFANAQGGRIYIGMNDSGVVVGVPDYTRLLEDIPNKVQMSLGIMVDVNLLMESGLYYIEINVAPSAFAVNFKRRVPLQERKYQAGVERACAERFSFEEDGRNSALGCPASSSIQTGRT